MSILTLLLPVGCKGRDRLLKTVKALRGGRESGRHSCKNNMEDFSLSITLNICS